MKNIFRGVLILLSLSSVSCQWIGSTSPSWKVNKKLYNKAEAAETEVVVSIWDQKAWLLDAEGMVILKTDVSTGVPGKDTPVGKHKVLEKMKQKRSNRYGKYVDIKTRKPVVEKSWLHEGPVPAGSVYEGTEMPYWMRLTWSGVGVHVGDFKKRTRASFGCIRVHEDAQPLIFGKTLVGTGVTVFEKSLLEKMAEKESFGWGLNY